MGQSTLSFQDLLHLYRNEQPRKREHGTTRSRSRMKATRRWKGTSYYQQAKVHNNTLTTTYHSDLASTIEQLRAQGSVDPNAHDDRPVFINGRRLK